MKFSRYRIRSPQPVFALLAVLGSVGTIHATSTILNATPSSITIYCSPTNPGYPVTVTLKANTAAATGTTIPTAVAATAMTGVTVVAVSSTATAITPAMSTTSGVGYTFTPTAGCSAANSGNYTFLAASTTSATKVPDVSVAVTIVNTDFLTATPSTIILDCSVPASLTPVSLLVTAAYAIPSTDTSSTLTPGLALVTPSLFTVAARANSASNITQGNSSASVGITYTFTPAASCTNGQQFSSQTYTFRAATTGAATTLGADLPVTVITVANKTSPLVAPAVALNCQKNSDGSYTNSGSQNFTVTSSFFPSSIPTSYTVSAATVPGWLTIPDQTAKATPHTQTLTVVSGCGEYGLNTTTTGNVHLQGSSTPSGGGTITWQDYVVPVSLNIVSPTTLLVSSPVSFSYTQKSGTPGVVSVPVGVSSGPSLAFTVDTTTLPNWLTVDYSAGTTNFTLHFSSTNAADQLAPGLVKGFVHLKVQNQADTVLEVDMQVNSPTPHLTVTPAVGSTLQNWTLGNLSYPTASITLVSSGGPIPYSIAGSGSLNPTASTQALESGLAYSFGTEIPITFSPAAFLNAVAGTPLTGIASITWGVAGTPAVTTLVTFTVNVQAPTATLNSIWPASLPAAVQGTPDTLTLTGTGFIKSSNPNIATQVGIDVNGTYTPSPAFTVSVTDTSHINLAIIVPQAGTTNLPFDATSNQNVTLSVCNPVNGVCNTVSPGSTAQFTIGSTPTVTELTSASAFVPQTTVAPYDIISLFGYDFCPTCQGVMLGTPNAAMVYPSTLTDPISSKSLTVTFVQNPTNSANPLPSTVSTAPLLFASNNQINLLVPGGLAGYVGDVDIVVAFGTLPSTPYTVTVTPTDPGIFTVGSDGQGNGAILSNSYTIIDQANPAAVRKASGSGTNLSDQVSIYVSGLGKPYAGVANNAAAAGAATTPATPSTGHWSGDCISTASFLAALNAATSGSLTSIDGAVIQSSLLDSPRLPPCLGNNGTTPTVGVTVGNIAAPISYAGWVADSIEGLYQINVQLPPSTSSFVTSNGTGPVTTAIQLPVVVTAGTGTSQPGVNVWVVPQLTVTAPAVVTGAIGAAWTTDATTASGGSGPYQYALTSGVLPLGLKFNTDGSISGTPALNTSGYQELTVTATDSATPAVTGTVSFQIQVTGGLVMTSSNTGPFYPISGILSANLTQITPSGGTPPYTFSLSPSTAAGIQIDTNGIVSSQTAAKGGTYSMTATAQDSTTPTPLSGNYGFTVNVALNFPTLTPTAQPAGQSNAQLARAQASGGTGTIGYSIDQASTNAGFAIDVTSGWITVGTAAPLHNWPMTVTATESGSKAPGSSVFATATQTITVSTLAPQMITFGTLSNVAYGSGTFTLSATASSGLTVLFASTTQSVCTVSTATVTILAGGPCNIHATQPGNGVFAPATPVDQGFTVTAEAQTITFGTLSNKVYGSGTFTLSATASSGLTVSFASTTQSVCTVSGTTVTLQAGGSCSITASQSGNGNFSAATPVPQGFTVTPESQTITFNQPPDQVMSSVTYTLVGSASSGLTVSYSSSTTGVCTVSGAIVTLVSDGTCTITAAQTGNANFSAATSVPQSFNVSGE